MVITMGAGDIWRYNDEYNAHLIKKTDWLNNELKQIKSSIWFRHIN
jgi:hypothetical protein